MAPGSPHSHQPLLQLYPASYMLPIAMVHKQGLPTMTTPLPEGLEKAKSEELPVGIWVFQMFRVLRGAVRHLRALLSKVLKRCGAMMEVLSSAVPPAQAGWERVRRLLGPGGGAREQAAKPAAREWNCGRERKVSGEEEAPIMKTVEGDGTPGEEGDLDLSDWMEWESEDEVLPSNCPAFPCQNTPSHPHRYSEEEQEEEERGESDWSDEDEEDEDDEEWDESDGSSEVDSELWESFLCSGDPFNPFRLSPPAGRMGSIPEPSRNTLPHITEGERERLNKGEGKRDDPPQAQKKAEKKVRFSEVVAVHPLVDWAFDSQAARDGGCWMEMARDRHRFRRRVQQASDIISPVLRANHRAWVWEQFQLN